MVDPKPKKKKTGSSNSAGANYGYIRKKYQGGRGVEAGYKPTRDKDDFGTYGGSRVGGTAPASIGVPKGGTKKQLKASFQNVKKSAASPQAKRSAKKLYKGL